MPPVEAWQKVLVSEDFFETSHGRYECTYCHGGREGQLSMDEAHLGVVADPSAQPDSTCGTCHPGVAQSHLGSQHRDLTGYRTIVALRAGQSELEGNLEAMFQQHCTGCHASCGQCHVARPHSVGKGCVRGHVFYRRPNMIQNCTACHGSRVGEEFRGEHAGIPADVHYNRGMQCVACHSANELHGVGDQGSSRYEVSNAPRCEDCHDVAGSNTYHSIHLDKLSCQVCHSVAYKNCYSCHVGRTERGLRRPSELDFKIGRNPMVSERRPYKYVVLRHVPIAPDTYIDWEPGGLPNFAAMPTWKMATPHNIQKNAPQTSDCTASCHNNPSIFLTADDLQGLPTEEIEANQSVVVPEVP